jgi:hypothetical protein
MSVIHVASFDIGKKNFAFYIEEFDTSLFSELENIPDHKFRYNTDGTPTQDFKSIIDRTCTNGKVILYKNVDLTKNVENNTIINPEYYYNMTDVLDEFSDYWDKCHTIIIEKQMAFGVQNNIMAIRLGQHCWSYFVCKYGRDKELIEFPAYHKTQVLGAEKVEVKSTKGVRFKSMTKPKRKKWCIQKAMHIFTIRDDQETLDKMKKTKKKDDLADVLCQLQAYKILTYT